jgi:cytolysin-activating lysine-acyltransferase
MANKENNKDNVESNVVELNAKRETTITSEDQQTPNKESIRLPDFIATESAVGAVAMLAAKSQSHKYLFSSDYEWLVIPPIAQKQFSLFRGQKNEPVAFVSWASVSDEVEERLLKGVTKLQPQDWKSGDKLYIIDIISPYNVRKEILKQLQEKQFKNQDIKVIRSTKEGKIEAKLLREIVEQIGDNKNG